MSRITIFTTTDLVELVAARDLLAGEGIDVVIQRSTLEQLGGIIPTGPAMHDVLVPQADAEKASGILEAGFKAPKDTSGDPLV